MLTPVLPKFIIYLSVPKDFPPCPSVCYLVSIVPSSLSLGNGVLLPLNGSGSTHSVCSMPNVVSMLVHSPTVRASPCHSVANSLPAGLNHSLSPSVNLPDSACSAISRSVNGRMYLVGCNLRAASSLYPYLRCRLVSWEIAGLSPASPTTATLVLFRKFP